MRDGTVCSQVYNGEKVYIAILQSMNSVLVSISVFLVCTRIMRSRFLYNDAIMRIIVGDKNLLLFCFRAR